MKIDEAYDEWSLQYDSNENKTRDLERTAAQSLLQQSSYDRILELGCGTGKNTAWLAEKSNRIVALDFSPGMLGKAKEKIQKPNVTFLQADLTKRWPVEEQFNLIICSLVLEHIENLNHIFSQAAERLVTGGQFYLCELHPFKQYRGTKARFQRGDSTFELEVYVHHISDFVAAALTNGFAIEEMKEWFDADGANEIPRLISFLFVKK